MIAFLATRNLVLQRKRYALIALAVLLGFSLITVTSGAAYGALETVKSKAARYFAGHVSVTGYYWGAPYMSNPDAVLETLEAADLPVRTVARRTIYYKTDAELFFGGETVRQRRLVGIDFAAERDELANLHFSDGSIDAMLGDDGRDGILISESAASLLGARVGDDVILYLTTDANQYNTATMIVRGVF
ncbi:MAG TPA: ABC transporter permease, partial [Spirochaetales bacterium]|nr:ABC transporter permease [Spirochaetales bacterium]